MIREFWEYACASVWISALVLMLSLPLGGCQSISAGEATAVATGVVAGNALGATVASIANPALAVPAAAGAAAGNAFTCAISAIFKGGC